MNKLNIRRDDTVVIISGKDKGQTGKVIAAMPEKERVVVQGRNMITCHRKPRGQNDQGGRIEREGTIHVSNVMLICPKCKKATRVGHVIENGKKLRHCKKCQANFD